MIKKVVKPVFVFSFLIFSIILLIASSFLLFVVTGPRSVPYLSAQIERTLSDISPNFDVEVGDTLLRWDGVKGGLGIHVIDAKVLDAVKAKTVGFPDVKVKLNIAALLLGSIEFKDVIITAPQFKMVWDGTIKEDDTTFFGPHPMSAYRQAITDILSAIVANNKKIPVKNITMEQVKLILNNGREEIVWFLQEVNTKFLLVDDFVTFNTEVIASFKGKDVSLNAQGFLEDKKWLRVKTVINDIPPYLVADIFPKFSWLNRINQFLSGDITLLLNKEGKTNLVDFRVFSSEKYNKPLDPKIELWGKFDVHDTFKEHVRVPELHANLAVINLPMDNLANFWPDNIAVKARGWLLPRLKGGSYTKTLAEINILPEEFVEKKLGNDSIKASVEFEGAELGYLPELPKIRNVSGKAKINSSYIDVLIHQAELKDSYSQDTRVEIFELGTPDVNIKIKGKATGRTEDIASFLVLKAPENKFTKENYNITGRADTDFLLKFPILENLNPQQIDVKVSSRLSETRIDRVSDNVKLDSGVFQLELDNDGVNLEGTAFLNSTHSEIIYNQSFLENSEYHDKFNVKMYVSPKELATFGVPEIPYISGDLLVDLGVVNKEGGRSVSGKVNAIKAKIDAPVLGLKKPIDKPLMLSFLLDDYGDKPVDVPYIEIVSDSLSVKGTAEISKEEKGYSEIHLERVNFGRNDFELILSRNFGNHYRINLKGKNADFEPILKNFSDLKKKNEEPFGITADFDLKSAVFSGGVAMKDVSMGIKCLLRVCIYAGFDGDFMDKGNVSMKFEPDIIKSGDDRYFKLSSDNAGNLLKGLGLIKNIKGGKLDVTAVTKSDPILPTKGSMSIEDFRVIKAPLLTKLLTLTSFTGILELLGGEGISFKEAKGEFTFNNNKFRLVGLKAHGSSLGITADGDIDITSSEIDLDGAVIPAYTFNKIIGSVPLVGQLLTGGEGVIATRYKIKGVYPEPKISVNPLSMLTPGFLRGIWGGKASEHKKEEYEEKERKEAEELKENEAVEQPLQ